MYQNLLGSDGKAIGWSVFLGLTVILFSSYYWMKSSNKTNTRKTNTRRMNTTREAHGEAALVEEARKLLVSSGNAQNDVARAMQALAALVSAVRIKDGDAAASALLERGRALFQEREGTDDERDRALDSLETQDSLLKERGMEGILEAAFADGSSVLCRKCSGLVKRTRWEAHKLQWCPALESHGEMVLDESDNEDDHMEVE